MDLLAVLKYLTACIYIGINIGLLMGAIWLFWVWGVDVVNSLKNKD